MENISGMGIDLSKRVFHLHAVNRMGRKLYARKVSRSGLLSEVSKLPQGCPVYIEAGGASHYWAREFNRLGMEALILAPQRVKPFVGVQKNDTRDAEAICEAGRRAEQRFVPLKSAEQLKVQMVHRIRERLVRSRTASANQLRAMLAEHGVILGEGLRVLRRYLCDELGSDMRLDAELREMAMEIAEEIATLDERIKRQEMKLKERVKQSTALQRAMTVPGVGLLTATAAATVSGNLNEFKNGRHFAAFLGLVPRQHSSGGKSRLGGITKRGDTHLRTLLIHGARTVIQFAGRKSDPYSLWVQKQSSTKGKNRSGVAVANKNARILWRILTSEAAFDSSALLRAA